MGCKQAAGASAFFRGAGIEIGKMCFFGPIAPRGDEI